MQHELRNVLLGSGPVAALAGDRVDWVEGPQGAGYPAIVLHLIGHRQGMTQQGPDGLWRGRVQVDCFGQGYAEAGALAGAVSGLLHGYRGGGFDLILLADQRDDRDEGAQGRPFVVSMDFYTNWRETNV